VQSVAADGSRGELADELVVVGMRTDPEPHQAAVWTVDAENVVVESDSAQKRPTLLRWREGRLADDVAQPKWPVLYYSAA